MDQNEQLPLLGYPNEELTWEGNGYWIYPSDPKKTRGLCAPIFGIYYRKGDWGYAKTGTPGLEFYDHRGPDHYKKCDCYLSAVAALHEAYAEWVTTKGNMNEQHDHSTQR